MSQIITPIPTMSTPPPAPTLPPASLPLDDDPFQLGWRYVRQAHPDGTETVEEVPLTYDDLLYPEEDDKVVQKPPHARDWAYCFQALTAFYHGSTGVVVLGDCRVDFGVEGVRPLGPDILVLFDVQQWFQDCTFKVAVEGGKPIAVIEIVSPSTRATDLSRKPELYYRVGVQKFVLVDRGPEGTAPARLLGYQRGPEGWLPLPANEQGRLDLSPVGMWLGLEDDRPWIYDGRTGERLPDLAEAMRAKATAEAQAREEAQARAAAEVKAREAEAKAQDEATRRLSLEERLRQMEEQLHRKQRQD